MPRHLAENRPFWAPTGPKRPKMPEIGQKWPKSAFVGVYSTGSKRPKNAIFGCFEMVLGDTRPLLLLEKPGHAQMCADIWPKIGHFGPQAGRQRPRRPKIGQKWRNSTFWGAEQGVLTRPKIVIFWRFAVIRGDTRPLLLSVNREHVQMCASGWSKPAI